MTASYRLVLTEANHDDQEFYTIGTIPTEVPPKDLFDRLPTDLPHVCADNSVCWMVDLWDDNHSTGAGVVDDREVSAEVAAQLIGGPDVLHAGMEAARSELAAIYASFRAG